MNRSGYVAGFCITLAVLCMAQMSEGAAQLAHGAKTSARPTSRNPALRQMQITFDPANVSARPAATQPSSQVVNGFQLDVGYDPTLVSMVPNSLVYASPFFPNGNAPVDNGLGLIDNVGGITSEVSAAPGDVDIFSITFQLRQGVPLDTPVSFSIFANDPTDYVSSFDPTGQQPPMTSYGPGGDPNDPSNEIQPTVVFAAVVPEPSSIALIAIGALALLHRRRRAPQML